MAATRIFVAALLLTVACGAKLDVTPLQKVTSMISDMIAKGKEEKHVEMVEFTKMQTWCTGTREETTKNIADEKAQITQLAADEEKAASDAETLADEIKKLEADVSQWTSELEAAKEVRASEKADYDASHADVSESISAVGRAVQVLKQQPSSVSQSLLQVQNTKLIPERAKAAIASYLAVAQNMESDEFAPEAAAYENQSGGVVALLEKLLAKFEDQKLTLEKEEMKKVGNFQVLEQQLTDNIKEGEKSIGEKTKAKAQRLEDEETALGDKEATEAALAADEKMLSDTNADCMSASDEYEKSQVMRAEEIKALETALKILSSDDVMGNPTAKTLVQTSATSFAQLRTSTHNDDVQSKVAEFLSAKAKKLHSRYLSLIAMRAEADPLAKVKKMIKDLIVKLMEEANAEAGHKAYCDTEMATNKMTRENKQSEVDELTAAIEEHTAAAAKLAVEITTLSDAIAEIKKKQSTATDLRNEEKEANAVIVNDSKVAQAAVEKATQVLKDFYGSAAASLLQSDAALGQEMADAAKIKKQNAGGIMGFLDVILSDFARVQTETEMAESMAQGDYDKFMDESTEDAEVKGVEMEHKEKKKIATEEATRALQKELDLTQTELDKALAYFDKLKPDCIDEGISYEEKVAMRKEEIVSLQEALKILSGEDLA